MSELVGILVFLLLFTAFGWLAVHHFAKVLRGLRTGAIEGLVLGFSGKSYNRTEEPGAFWINVAFGLLGAAVGTIVMLWILLIIGLGIAAYEGYPTL